MGFKCGIVGLPNVGKSTLFNALTKAGIAAENYPFCTIEPNIGVVAMPDARLAALARGHHVTLTDYEAKSVVVARHNARLNEFQQFEAFELDWRSPPAVTYPVILGCDLLYEKRNFVPNRTFIVNAKP